MSQLFQGRWTGLHSVVQVFSNNHNKLPFTATAIWCVNRWQINTQMLSGAWQWKEIYVASVFWAVGPRRRAVLHLSKPTIYKGYVEVLKSSTQGSAALLFNARLCSSWLCVFIHHQSFIMQPRAGRGILTRFSGTVMHFDGQLCRLPAAGLTAVLRLLLSAFVVSDKWFGWWLCGSDYPISGLLSTH